MIEFASLVAGTAVLIAVLGAIQLTILMFRNPFRSSWLKRPGMENFASVTIVAALSIAIGLQINGLIGAGVPILLAIAVVPAIVFGTGYALWRLFNCRERLRRADAGQSPFYRLTHRPSVGNIHLGA